MRGVVAFSLLCGLGIGLAGCADPNTKATHIEFGSTTDTVTMGPALRLVTERRRQLDDGRWLPTMYSEPSPDVAIAFGRSLAASGSVTESGGTSGSGSVNAASTEVATQLAGRTAGVLALRDGLYAACQSYVNGVLGHDAYAIVLSQYGNLLVALTGQSTGGNPSVYTPEESTIAALLVACISEHDPTRIRPQRESIKYRGRYEPDINPLLSEKRCKNLLDKIAAGSLVTIAKKNSTPAAKTKAPTAAAAPKAGEKVVTVSKTVSEKSGPPLQAVAAPATPAPPATPGK